MKKKRMNLNVPKLAPSVSIYANPLNKFLRPFSAIFDKCAPENIKQEQLLEIEEVKNRMAKYKLNVPLKKLMDSMVVPDGLTSDK